MIRERAVECPCGKRVYETKASATRAAKVTKPDGSGEATLHAFPCPDGKGWHVGHTSTTGKQNRTIRKRYRRG